MVEKPPDKYKGEYKIELSRTSRMRKEKAKLPWSVAKGESLNIVKKIELFIPHYSYEDPDTSLVTDEKVSVFITEKLSDAKRNIFDITDLLYELHKEDKLNKSMVFLRDELDIFSDEVKARYCKWKDITSNWMRKIIRHDLKLIQNSIKLEKDIQELKAQVISGMRSNREPEWEKYANKIDELKKQINELVRLFKERESICNLKGISLEKTYKLIRDDLRDRFD